MRLASHVLQGEGDYKKKNIRERGRATLFLHPPSFFYLSTLFFPPRRGGDANEKEGGVHVKSVPPFPPFPPFIPPFPIIWMGGGMQGGGEGGGKEWGGGECSPPRAGRSCWITVIRKYCSCSYRAKTKPIRVLD
nr:hypothetical protein [Morchella crassipes]